MNQRLTDRSLRSRIGKHPGPGSGSVVLNPINPPASLPAKLDAFPHSAIVPPHGHSIRSEFRGGHRRASARSVGSVGLPIWRPRYSHQPHDHARRALASPGRGPAISAVEGGRSGSESRRRLPPRRSPCYSGSPLGGAAACYLRPPGQPCSIRASTISSMWRSTPNGWDCSTSNNPAR